MPQNVSHATTEQSDRTPNSKQLDFIENFQRDIVLFAGAGTQALLQAAFSVRPGDHSVRLPGMLSRKKQMVPALLDAIARMGE